MKFSTALFSSIAACLLSTAATAGARDVPYLSALESRQNRNGGGKGGDGGNTGGNNGGGNPQTSKTLDASVINSNLAKTGQEGGGDPGQVASLTSTNNFIS